MSQEKTGPDATPRVGLDLGRQIFDDPAGGEQQEERIRQRAYAIWEREGGTGDPQDHWYRAERELSEAPQERSEATVEDAPPVSAVGAVDSVGGKPAADINTPKES